MAARARAVGRGLRGSPRALLAGVVAGGTVLCGLLALPFGRPRIFGDELIYWEISRAFAWTGHFTVRGGTASHYGIVYPALLAIAQRLGGDQHSAYAIAQWLNALLFSLAAVPVYAIAARVLRRAFALLAAALSVALPSCIYTSAIMTESAFYPLFAVCVLAMLRALERPSLRRQLLVVAAAALLFLVRAQAVVLLPSYLIAALLLVLVAARRGERIAALRIGLRQQAPVLGAIACAAAAAVVVRGRTALGPYHVLVTSYPARSLVHWALANLADLELYVGVVPLAAFGVVLVQSVSSRAVSPDLRRLAILSACLGAGLLATVAALSASTYGLGRAHERNLFYVAPFILICFLAWLEHATPRPRRTTAAVAVALVLLPLSISASVISKSGGDALALVVWAQLGLASDLGRVLMTLLACVFVAVFLVSGRRVVLVGICVAALATTLVAGEVRAAHGLRRDRAQWRDVSWIDRAVGRDARVVALWATSRSGLQFERIEGLWSDEFFNRSVRDVASADGPLPDGLPVETLRVSASGCLIARVRPQPGFAVVETERPLDAPVVAVSPSRRATLYRLGASGLGRRCTTRLR